MHLFLIVTSFIAGCVTLRSGICEPIVASQYTANFGKGPALNLEYE
ncbi:hypothetical protein [Novosphingobium sp.]|nr:hypothetical protein [Novosphingobium sp.]